MHTKADFIWLKYSKNCVILQFKINIFYFSISCNLLLLLFVIQIYFLASLLQSSVSHDPSEIIITILSMLKTDVLLNVFWEL